MTRDNQCDSSRNLVGEDLQRLLILAYTRLFLLPERADGSKATWVAMSGHCELHLLEISVPQGADVPPLWVELYDCATRRIIDSIGCRHLHEAGPAAERLLAEAAQRHRRFAQRD
jgi:hypothetical protein